MPEASRQPEGPAD